MIMNRIASIALVVVVAIAGLAGCASHKEPAEQAVANIEKSLQGAAATAEKYLPEQYATVAASVEGLRQNLAAEDYGAVVAAAPGVADQVRKLIADSAIRKAQVKVEMENEWVELVKTMPADIGAVDTRILRMSGGRLPAGMSRDAFKEKVAEFDAAKATWGRAAEAGNAGDLETAVTLSREAKATIDGVKEAFGMSAS